MCSSDLAVAASAVAAAALAEVPVAVDSAAVITAPAVSMEAHVALIITVRIMGIIIARVSLVGGDLATTDTVVEDVLAVLWARCWHLLSFCSLLAL